ncbi:MAG: hypothetical protein CL910_04860 [Deltaproteobacteria bacterium]|nr:hypothetical protein [Deltaproteobacteria bacterium]
MIGRARALGVVGLLVGGLFLGPTAASALEFWDGRVDVHGYYEQQIRSIWEDFSGSNDWDLTQWYHVLDLEIEAEFAPDGIGPFDLVSGFARIEARFDCVWRRGCGLFRNVDVYGDRPGRLPQRLQSGRRSGWANTSQYLGDVRREFDYDITFLPMENKDHPAGSRVAVGPWGSLTYGALHGISAGLDGEFDAQPRPDSDDPAQLVFSNLSECLFASQRIPGPENGFGVRQIIHNLKCKIEPIHDADQVPNPFRSRDPNHRVLGGAGGFGELPFRPAPEVRFDAGAPKHVPQGIWYPSVRLQQALREGEFDAIDQNFTVNELQWNRGASQQDEKELKEAYLDIEMFDSRLWIRAGKQNIVWGKTELFRTTDQFNPQDLALASLPNLEESRIALWALRATWSFYEVGPFEDVRLEIAANFDQYEPADLGRCGEPYSPLVLCSLTFGYLNHGQNGFGLAGSVRPPNPWNSWHGVEVGARLEWRWNRFSFAITDFYGYSDFPYIDIMFTYSRNVDPESGRPRKANATGRCRRGTEDSCLTPDNALLEHPANQSNFAWVCAATVGVAPTLDASACAQTLFNSQVVPEDAPLHLAGNLGVLMSGQNGVVSEPATAFTSGTGILEPLGMFTLTTRSELTRYAPFGQTAVFLVTGGFGITPLVPLTRDMDDGLAATSAIVDPAIVAASAANGFGAFFIDGFLGAGLSPFLSDEQEALLGCGPFYGTNCDVDGIDFLNMDANAFFEAWPTGQGTFLGGEVWDTTRADRPQPGTVGFEGFTCAAITGCRGPGDPGYDPRKDGTILVGGAPHPVTGEPLPGAVHPFTGQPFRAEIAIVSWNALMLAVALSQGDEPAKALFDPDDPFARNKCSFREPVHCAFVLGLWALSGSTRATVKAGGNGRFGRRQFQWHGGNEIVLRYEKRNVLGFSMDFAEDLTKTNWGMEFTWIEGEPGTDAEAYDGSSKLDSFNLTVSVDRPTFINFLNANRTFFFNSQWFFQYVEGYRQSHTSTGPWNMLMTLSVSTGYFQDRLLPFVTGVYDMRSNSGAFLTAIVYRFTENFSTAFGVAAFSGRFKEADAAINDVGSGVINRIGKDSEKQFFEPGLSLIRERDEIFMSLRYTF